MRTMHTEIARLQSSIDKYLNAKITYFQLLHQISKWLTSQLQGWKD